MLALVWVALMGMLIATGEGVVHSSALTAFDSDVTSFVVAHRTPALDGVMKAVTWVGSWVALLVTGVLIAILCARRLLPIAALPLAIVAWGGEAGAVAVTKRVVRRDRPPQDLWLVNAHGWSMPSGHAAVGVLVFTALALIMTVLVHNTVVRASTWAAAAVMVAGVGFSRIELGVHWTTDVIAGILFVAGWLAVMGAVFSAELSPAQPRSDEDA